ncbi:hypothetical protein [Breznakia pachnodae]|jgi:hypothetical protein|uniref:Uncharacterized protein n=1 Tax=Breznakia pachnodae TaxID=265178 RepID=A0ABU0E5T2_9FIRM|nr:hypothetical protein [Breznakia pachnodae]MDQ0362145.1 hypothetical protein [Breznakia pachnodae]
MKANEINNEIMKCLNLCIFEKAKRNDGIVGESTISQLNEIITELSNLKETLNSRVLPPTQNRYLESFARAFKVWGWDMIKPSDLFLLLMEINNKYRDL